MLTHRLTNTPLHKTWMRMNRRCNNKNSESYHRYGGRGIKVCDRWKSFENFYNDMFPSYSEGMTLERVDNDKDYEPSNVRWATKKEQANNRSTNRIITSDGVSKTLMQWSEVTGIPRTCIESRIKLGWSVERALTTPVRKIRTIE
jgi:hypothetical protein